MSFKNPCDDWRCESGWPAAALALAWRITGNISYGSKAISTYIPYFEGVPKVVGRLQSITHYGLAYDWLQGHPDFTEKIKSDLANKIVRWSDLEFINDTTKPSYVAQDSDHLTAATTSHFVCGIALYGDHPNATSLMDRGWLGIKSGYNNNSLIPNVSIEDMFQKTSNGHPLPGWDYYWMSDGWDLQNLFYVLDELGYVSEAVKNWWPRAIINFIHNIDPANTHYRWLGDTQSGVLLSSYSGYIWSGISNCIYMSEKYGFTNEAAIGRQFLDNLTHSQWGVGEGDPMLLMARGFSNTASRINFTNSSKEIVPRLLIEGVGEDQRMGYGYFRSSWSKNGTWGGFSGVGNYLVDHMHASAGSFFLWRNGEYLTTDPHNYGGEVYGEIFNSLSISNPLRNDKGGPLFYSNEFHAFLERGFVRTSPESGDLFYLVLNANKSYNVPLSKWDTCGGCGQPVLYYRRHFLYDGGDIIFIIDKASLKNQNNTAWRFRTQNPKSAPKIIKNDLISALSEKGSYRSLIRVLEPAGLNWTFINETEAWKGTPTWAIDPTMLGYGIKATNSKMYFHLWISVIHIGESSRPDSDLDDAIKIESNRITGIYASKSILVLSKDQNLMNETNYLTPNVTAEGTRHLVGDLIPGKYSVSASKDGRIGDFEVKSAENAIFFKTSFAGIQNITITAFQGSFGAINLVLSSLKLVVLLISFFNLVL